MPRASEPLQRAARDRLHGLAAPHGLRATLGLAEPHGPGEPGGDAEPGGLAEEPGEVTTRRGLLAVRAAAPGWVPDAPADVGRAGPPLDPPDLPDPEVSVASPWAAAPDGQDVRDVVARIRAGALDSAAAAYTSLHGHPLEHPSPDAPVGRRRWLLSVRLAVIAALAVVVLGAGVVARATLSAPSVPVATAPAPGGQLAEGAAGSGETSAGPGAAVPAPSPADVVVHVVGQVNAPGVVHLPAGSRVGDAVAAAGGAAPGAALAAVNLARVLEDGEQIVVPAPGEVAPGTTGTTGAGGAAVNGADREGANGAATGEASALIDLNTADAADLESLPGIGPVLAQRIVDWRTQHTRFTAVDELGEVAGIGDTLLGRLRELVRV